MRNETLRQKPASVGHGRMPNSGFGSSYAIDRFVMRSFGDSIPFRLSIVDFVCLKKKRVIEAGGGQHIEQQIYNKKRTVFLEARGFRVLRFWNDEILIQIEDVLDVIFCALNEPPLPFGVRR